MKFYNIIIKYRFWLGLALLALGIAVNFYAGFWPAFVLYLGALVCIVTHFLFGPMRLIQEHMENGDIEGAEKVILKDYRRAAEEIANYLYRAEIESLFVEGGARTLKHFINYGLWDEARIFCGNSFIPGDLRAPEISGIPLTETTLSRSILKMIANK